MTEARTQPGPHELPNIKQIEKFVDVVRHNIFIRDWKDTLDDIALWWQEGTERSDIGLRFRKATMGPGIPKLELQQANKVLQGRDENIDSIIISITTALDDPKLKWGDIQKIREQVQNYEEDTQHHIQINALLEAISESPENMRDVRVMRQRVAQHAWDELWNTGMYRIWDYSGRRETIDDRTTVDFIEEEKAELKAALDNKLWSAEKRKQQEKVYKTWRAVIRENFDDEINAELRKLWAAVIGEEGQQVSAIDILENTEQIYQYLQAEGAFDIDLEDYYDALDEESDDE